MDDSTRRSFLKPNAGRPAGAPALEGVAGGVPAQGTSRRAFLQGGVGAAAGAAVILATPKVAAVALGAPGSSVPVEPKGVASTPTGPAPQEPVTAYVRDAARGEVTVMFGTRSTTYTNHALVKRLLDAAR